MINALASEIWLRAVGDWGAIQDLFMRIPSLHRRHLIQKLLLRPRHLERLILILRSRGVSVLRGGRTWVAGDADGVGGAIIDSDTLIFGTIILQILMHRAAIFAW